MYVWIMCDVQCARRLTIKVMSLIDAAAVQKQFLANLLQKVLIEKQPYNLGDNKFPKGRTYIRLLAFSF